MSIYNLENFGPTNFRILTNAVDEISDELVFYIDQTTSRITDDGYMFNEFELLSSKMSIKKREELCTSFAHFYFCEFDKETKEIYFKIDKNTELDDVVIQLIQVCTAISTIINYERFGKSDD
ncbi:hypothetical protein ABB44_08070 [Companilactobacillus farciminis]|nr:hypothetical protein ABB45_08050 [Companilactobacillus farciminis]AKS51873.1 hypothetical protein ABB44_08070 [Companilactobacillus farciminis]